MEKQELKEKPKKNLTFKPCIMLKMKKKKMIKKKKMMMMMMIMKLRRTLHLSPRQFQNFLKKKQGNRKLSNFKKDGHKEESCTEALRCYKCNKIKHIKVDYLLLQNKNDANLMITQPIIKIEI